MRLAEHMAKFRVKQKLSVLRVITRHAGIRKGVPIRLSVCFVFKLFTWQPVIYSHG